MIAMSRRPGRTARFLACTALMGCAAITVAGCVTTGGRDITGSVAAATPRTDAGWRRESEAQGERYRANPSDSGAAVAYGRALQALGQRSQAVSVLQQASMRNPNDAALLGAYGRALADVGNYDQALEVLGRAHTPDQPDWHILSAQGAVLDQLGRHADAQRYYSSALKMIPDEPSVLSNLGLSYALGKDLTKAEATLRRGGARPGAGPPGGQKPAACVRP